MLKPNNENSNQQFLAASDAPSNTPLFLHLPLTLTANSFTPCLPLQTNSQLFLTSKTTFIHLDYLRLSSTGLTNKSFDLLWYSLFSGIVTKNLKNPWHPDPNMPRGKKYPNRIVSNTGIVLGYRKRAKNRGVNTRYVYDIMIDFTGAYFSDLSLLEQQELIKYLNTNYQLKCHRLDVAIDDCSRSLIPVNSMIVAFLEGNNFGFEVIDDSYLDIVNNQLVGTLALGSRKSQHYIRIYTKHRNFVRYEAEFKGGKAQKLFDKIANLDADKIDSSSPLKSLQKALAEAALNCIDFRDKSKNASPKNATKKRIKPLSFWQLYKDKIFSLIENGTIRI